MLIEKVISYLFWWKHFLLSFFWCGNYNVFYLAANTICIIGWPDLGSDHFKSVFTLCYSLHWQACLCSLAGLSVIVFCMTVKTSPSLTDVAMARLAQGTKVLAEGGHEKGFQQTFQTLPGEKLLKAYACYLSTSTGPVIGTLYISTKRVAFCSDNPLCHYPAPGQQEWIYYKVFSSLLSIYSLLTFYNHGNRSWQSQWDGYRSQGFQYLTEFKVLYTDGSWYNKSTGH